MVTRPPFLSALLLLVLAATACSTVRGEQGADLIAGWIADAIPRQYEKKEDWGRTRRVTVGLDVSRRGLRLKKKQVPHGIWKHYRITLAGGADGPRVELEPLQSLAPGRARAKVRFTAPLDFWGRTRIYAQGVHLGTYTAEGDATVYLRLDCEIGVRIETSGDSPAVAIEPVVHRAELKLKNFRLKRISNADGPAVHELAKVVKHVLEDELEPPKLTKKLNRAIAKKQDRLRWDLGDVLSLEEITIMANDEAQIKKE